MKITRYNFDITFIERLDSGCKDSKTYYLDRHLGDIFTVSYHEHIIIYQSEDEQIARDYFLYLIGAHKNPPGI